MLVVAGIWLTLFTKALINAKVVEGITSAIKDEVRQRAIFSNSFNLQQIDTAGHVSVLVDEYFFDEIEFIEIKEDTLYAKYWYYQKSSNPFTFQLNLLNSEIRYT